MNQVQQQEVMQNEESQRILMRDLARELSVEELNIATGGTTSCSGCRADDCDAAQD